MSAPQDGIDRVAAAKAGRFARVGSWPAVVHLAGLAVAAAAVTLIASRSHTVLPAPTWLAATVSLLLVLALRRGGEPSARRDLPIAAVLGLSSASAFLVPGLLYGHDTMHHIWGAAAYQNAWRSGDLLPVWLHHLGLGMPLPLFYGPLPFWAMAPFALAGGGPAQLLSGSFVVAACMAAVAAWVAAARWTGDRRAALVAAAAWAYAPYRLLDSNYRNALGESWALALLPLAIVGFDRLLVAPSRRAFLWAALALAAVALAHPLSLVMVAIALGALGVVRAAALARRAPRAAASALARAAAAGVAGLALAGFFLVPLAFETRYLSLEGSLGGHEGPRFADHGVGWRELVERSSWDTLRYSNSDRKPPRDEMPFYLGWVLSGALVAAAIVAWRRRGGGALTPLLAVASVAVALSLRLLTPVAVLLPGVVLLQFPWRFLGPASAAAALVLGGLAAAPRGRSGSRGMATLATLLALGAVADGFAFSGAVARVPPWEGLAVREPLDRHHGVLAPRTVPEPWPDRVFGVFLPPWRCCSPTHEVYSAYPIYFTPAARLTAARRERASVGLVLYVSGELRRLDAWPYARLWRPGAEAPFGLEFERARGRVTVRLPAAESGRLEVAEQYFPGWQVEVGGRWREVEPSADGLLAAEVAPGTPEIRFRFDRWRADRAAGWLSTLLAAGGLALYAGRPRRSRVPGAPAG